MELAKRKARSTSHFKLTMSVEIPRGPGAEQRIRKLTEGVGLLLSHFLSDEEKAALADKIGVELSRLKVRKPAGRRATA